MNLDWLAFMLWGGLLDGGVAGGLLINLGLALTTFSIGLLLAIPLALIRSSAYEVPRLLVKAYVEIVRGTPLLLLVFWCHFVIPIVFPDVAPIVGAAVALSLYASAYLTEILRAGLNNVPKGEVEAAYAAGLSTGQVTWWLRVPQALRGMFPTELSFLISLFKDTSVVYLVGVVDLMQSGLIAAERQPSDAVRTYVTLGAIFFVASTGLVLIGKALERHYRWAFRVPHLKL